MDSENLVERLLADLSEHMAVLLVCRCSIEYWGRSRSVIGVGERIIILKPDTTIIVHSPSGFKPVNWMSSPCDTTASQEGGKTLIFAQRTQKPYEEIRITVEDVRGYSSFRGLSDTEKLELTHTEHDMRDYLAAHPAEVDPGFKLKSTEYKTPVGLMDLYGKIGERYCVVELKSEKAGLPAVLQLKRYRDWLRERLRQDVEAILLAPSVAANPLALLGKEGMRFKRFNVHQLPSKKNACTLGNWMGNGD